MNALISMRVWLEGGGGEQLDEDGGSGMTYEFAYGSLEGLAQV